MPSKIHKGQEVAAVRGTLRSLVALMVDPPFGSAPATHIGIATDSKVESFRNELYEGYKDGSGIEKDLLSQFPLLDEGLQLAGFQLWAEKKYEADDALASAAKKFAKSKRVGQVVIYTADKDLTQCITKDGKVSQFDRVREKHYRYKDVVEKFGVPPESIPDYLALVGDSADGIPGLSGFGAKTAATLLQKYKFIEKIPKEVGLWDVALRGADKLAKTFCECRDDALLYKKLTTLVSNAEIGTLDELKWRGPKLNTMSGAKSGSQSNTDSNAKSEFEKFCSTIAAPDIYEKLSGF